MRWKMSRMPLEARLAGMGSGIYPFLLDMAYPRAWTRAWTCIVRSVFVRPMYLIPSRHTHIPFASLSPLTSNVVVHNSHPIPILHIPYSISHIPSPHPHPTRTHSPLATPPRPNPTRFDQFDSSRTGQLTSYDLQRLLSKDSLMEDPREDAVKMVRLVLRLRLSFECLSFGRCFVGFGWWKERAGWRWRMGGMGERERERKRKRKGQGQGRGRERGRLIGDWR